MPQPVILTAHNTVMPNTSVSIIEPHFKRMRKKGITLIVTLAVDAFHLDASSTRRVLKKEKKERSEPIKIRVSEFTEFTMMN